VYPVSRGFLEAIRGPHTAYGFVEAWRAGARLSYTTSAGETATRLPLDEEGGSTVAVDGGTPGTRRNLTVNLAREPGLWDVLAPTGVELRAYTVLEYLNHATEVVPQGVFPVDVQRVGYGPDGTLQLTAPDRWATIQAALFPTPRRIGGGGTTARAVITSLLTEALPPGTAVADYSTSVVTVPVQTPDEDRARTIADIATAAALDVYFDRDGTPTIRDVPRLNPDRVVWTVDSGDVGVMTGADRERNRQRTFNMIALTSDRNDGTAPFATQYVWNNDAASDSYAGPGTGAGPTPPAATAAGPMGQRVLRMSSPVWSTAQQAITAGQARLAQTTALASQLTLEAVPNPALDDGDTITAQLPPERWGQARTVEWHLIDSLTVPLVPSKNAQTITTRSTRPDGP
jgi:hypothetical protein